MLSSPACRYSAPFREQVQGWIVKLSTVGEVVEQWLMVQVRRAAATAFATHLPPLLLPGLPGASTERLETTKCNPEPSTTPPPHHQPPPFLLLSARQNMWMYMEAVFSGGDIVKQLPQEAKRFQNIDKNYMKVCVWGGGRAFGRVCVCCLGGCLGTLGGWLLSRHCSSFVLGPPPVPTMLDAPPTRASSTRLQVVSHALEVQNAVATCHGNELLKSMLPHLLEQLELCQKSLSAYLETKRAEWAAAGALPGPVPACSACLGTRRHRLRLLPRPAAGTDPPPLPAPPPPPPPAQVPALLLRVGPHAAGDPVPGLRPALRGAALPVGPLRQVRAGGAVSAGDACLSSLMPAFFLRPGPAGAEEGCCRRRWS